MRLGHRIVVVARTVLLGSGVRSVWYLPDDTTVHAIEDDPIPPGTYFLRPDETGKYRHWVIECVLGTRVAVPARGDRLPRKHVEVHSGTLLEHTDACTCPGLRITANGVDDSPEALAHMRDALKRGEDDPPIWVLDIRGPQ